MTQIGSPDFSHDASFSEIEGKKYALVVGVNKPEKARFLPTLRYAESDAKGIGYLLRRKTCSFALPSGVLIGEVASTQNVRKAMNYLIDGKSANDLLLFYFIGHGYPIETAEGKAETYLVTSDFDPDHAIINPHAYLSLNEIQKTLYEYQKTASVICLLDCCNTLDISASSPPEKQLTQSLEAFRANVRNIEQSSAPSHRIWAVLASTEPRALAYERSNDDGDGHTLMTGMILDALNGDARGALDKDGNLTLQTLYPYLQTQMQKLGSSNQYSIMQATLHKPIILAHHPLDNPVIRNSQHSSQSPVKQLFDETISPATFTDLDLEQVHMFLQKARVQIQRDYQSGPDEQSQMQALGLLQDEHASYAALLCFGRDPSRQIAGAYTRCICWSDTKRLKNGQEDQREFRGSLLQQFTQVCDFLHKHLRFSRVIDRNGSTERPEIPFQALDEAVANALIHREYVTEADRTVRTEGVQVEIFSDRVEITSPGGPPVPLDGHCHPRNPQIMRIFYLVGHAENRGTGITRMQHLIHNTGLLQPDIRPSQHTLTITLFRPTLALALETQTEANMQGSQDIFQAQTLTSSFGNDQEEVYDINTSHYPLVQYRSKNNSPKQDLIIGDNEHIHSHAQPSVLSIRPNFFRLHKPPVSFIMVIIVALVVSIYFMSKQSYLLTPRPYLGPASTTIEIASDFPSSSRDTTSSQPLQNGVQMAINEANNEHFLPGYTLKSVRSNDVENSNHHDPQQGANNLKQAINNNLVAGVIGAGNSLVAFKELPLANQAPLALLSPSATFPCLTKSAADDPNCAGINDVATQLRTSGQLTFFRLATTDDRQGKATADYFFKTNGYRKVLLLKDDRDAYSLGLAQAFQLEWESLGGSVIAIDLPQSITSVQNYQNTLQAVASTQPNLIYFAGGSFNGSYILQALSHIATLKTVPFAGSDGTMRSNLLAGSQRDANAPIYASLPIADPAHTGAAMGTNFESDYLANNFQDYLPYAASAYDCTRILIQAIKIALQTRSTPHGAQDQVGAKQFRQAVLQALRHLPPYTGATGKHSFDGNGDTTNHTISFYQADLSTSPLSWTWLQQVNV